jgi:HTH-type transcriptional regulator, competence development regulator
MGSPGLDPLRLAVQCVLHTKQGAVTSFSDFLRDQRETKRQSDPAYSLRQVAERVGIEPSYLSRIERGIESPPSEETIVKLAAELRADPDVLLALAGKVSSDLQSVIRRRPELFGQLLREMRDMPDHAVLRLVREVRDGEW